MVLVCAGLFVRSVIALHRIDPGYDTSKLLAVSLEGHTYNRPDLRRCVEDLHERIKGLPGIRALCMASSVPLSERGSARGVSHIDGVEIPESQRNGCQYRVVSPEYFKTLNMPLSAGRNFSARDTLHAPKVAVINDVMARKYWPHQDPLGKFVTFRGLEDGLTVQVVGVVKAAKMRSIIEEQRSFAHLPLAQHTAFTPALLIRTSGNPQPLIPIIRREVASLGRDVVCHISTVADRVTTLLFPQHAIATILNTFGLAGLLLCFAGLYSVIAYAVKQRTREIGIRMALGAETRHVVLSVLRRGAWLTAVGLGLGLALSLAAIRVLGSQLTSLRRWNKFVLFGVDTWDLLTIVAVPVLVLVVALLAVYLPARRAARIDPMQALRYE
jgi:predicted permease